MLSGGGVNDGLLGVSAVDQSIVAGCCGVGRRAVVLPKPADGCRLSVAIFIPPKPGVPGVPGVMGVNVLRFTSGVTALDCRCGGGGDSDPILPLTEGVLQLNAGVSGFFCGGGVPQPFAGAEVGLPKTRFSNSVSLLVDMGRGPGAPPKERMSVLAGAMVVPSSWSLRVCSCSIFAERDLIVDMKAWNYTSQYPP